MTRIHAEREFPSSKSLSMSRNSKLFTAPTGAQVNIFSTVAGLPFYRDTFALPRENSLKNTQTETKRPKETTKKPHPNRKPPPKSHTFQGFYKSSVLLTPLASVSCSVLYEIAHSFTAWKRGTSFNNKHPHGCPKNHQSLLQGTRDRGSRSLTENLKLSPGEDVRFSMLRKLTLKLLARLNI